MYCKTPHLLKMSNVECRMSKHDFSRAKSPKTTEEVSKNDCAGKWSRLRKKMKMPAQANGRTCASPPKGQKCLRN